MKIKDRQFWPPDNRGQALLPLLILMVIIIILGAGVLYLSIGSLLLSSYSQSGEEVLMATEGAMENGLLMVLRNPAYAGESLQVGAVPCTINTAGSAPLVMTVKCDSGRAVRQLQAEVSLVNGQMQVDHLIEIE